MNFQLLIWTLILHIQLSESIFVDEFQIKEIPTINEWFACDSQQPLLVANSYGYLVSINFTTSKFVPYPDGLNCSWVLLAPADKVIFLTVQNLDLEKDRRILIYDGFDEISKLGAIFSRSRANNYRSTGNSVFIRFEGRNSTKEGEIALFTGFKIYFEHRKKPKQCLTSQKRCKNGYECIEKKSVCDTVFDCDDGSDEENCGSISSDFPQSCGNPAITPRLSLFKIVGGTVAKPGSWPWQVSLRVIHREPDGNLCGASIINRDWVLTAAHCFDEYNEKRMWTLSFAKFHKMIVDETQFTRYISKLIVHPKYNATKKQNDIALVKLNAQLPTDNDLVAPICLPEKGDEEGETAGTIVYAIGWGETYGDPLYSNVLKQTALPIVTDNECKLSNPWLDINSVLCAGYELGGKDTCKGDSGGPLMWFSKRSKKWVLLGITSFGAFFCGTPNDPGVYTKVSNYIQWIQNTTKYE